MSVLVCAATGSEARACAKGIADSGQASSFEVLETGVGLARATRALERRLSRGPRPALVVSSGFAGAYSPGLATLSWVTCDEVALVERGALKLRKSAITLATADARVCRIASSRELVVEHGREGAGPFAELQAPVVVDMETAALAEVCARENVPLAVLRMITDTPAAPLPVFLVSIAAAMAETRLRERFGYVVKALRHSLTDPVAVAHVARDSTTWLAGLRRGWEKNAEFVRNCSGKLDTA